MYFKSGGREGDSDEICHRRMSFKCGIDLGKIRIYVMIGGWYYEVYFEEKNYGKRYILMKNRLKKAVSLLLTAAMLMGMSVTSFAAGNSDGEGSQPVLRGPAAPITSVTVEGDGKWLKSEHRIQFTIKQLGIGPGTVTFDGTEILPYERTPIYGSGTNEVTGWYLEYKSPKLYNAGVYKMEGVFISSNGTQKIWKVSHKFTVTESDLL